MYGFVHAVEDETHLQLRPMNGDELVSVKGTPGQVEQFRRLLEETDIKENPVIVQFDRENMVLKPMRREGEHGLLRG